MIYGCIECHRTWCSIEKFDSLDIDLDTDTLMDISHGICPECFQNHKANVVHRHQQRNGYSECYNRNDQCSNSFCMFKTTCGPQAINDWRSKVVLLATG
jgi:hypothetical protein